MTYETGTCYAADFRSMGLLCAAVRNADLERPAFPNSEIKSGHPDADSYRDYY